MLQVVFIIGEVSDGGMNGIDIEAIARDTIREIGYSDYRFGFDADKIVVDTYGGFARHGGGAFSGKDPTKVDRSASYAARYVAKNLVAAGIAHQCEIQIAYAIGVAQPVSVSVNTFGTGIISDEAILKLIDKYFDLRPSSIINGLGLRKPIYKPTAAYGHFGRKDLQLPWEWTDKATVLRNALAEMQK